VGREENTVRKRKKGMALGSKGEKRKGSRNCEFRAPRGRKGGSAGKKKGAATTRKEDEKRVARRESTTSFCQGKSPLLKESGRRNERSDQIRKND